MKISDRNRDPTLRETVITTIPMDPISVPPFSFGESPKIGLTISWIVSAGKSAQKKRVIR